MIINIDNEYRIVNKDGMNWDVEKLVTSPELINGKPNPRAGEERWVCKAHCAKLELACSRVLSMKITRETTEDVASIIKSIQLAEVHIKLAIAEHYAHTHIMPVSGDRVWFKM